MALRKRVLSIIVIITILSILSSAIVFWEEIYSLYGYSKAALSYYGSTGQEVKNIQYKLAIWKYYNGKIDGIYGYKTYMAVRKFQAKNGLKVDGIAGPETLAALGLPTGQAAKATSAQPSSNRNLDLLAHLVYGEARGEPYIGQVAVAAVVINRTRDSRFPNTIAGVIYQPGAFDAVSDGQINLAPNETAYKAAKDALNGWDPTGGALYYYNPRTATSKWIWSRKIVKVIGKHNFAI